MIHVAVAPHVHHSRTQTAITITTSKIKHMDEYIYNSPESSPTE